MADMFLPTTMHGLRLKPGREDPLALRRLRPEAFQLSAGDLAPPPLPRGKRGSTVAADAKPPSLANDSDKAAAATPETNAALKQPRTAVGLLGGTGLVGRLLARALIDHPFLCCGPIVGSPSSAGRPFEDVWRAKEAALTDHYGDQLWEADKHFPAELSGVVVSGFEGLLASECRVVISTIAPRLGHLEDKLRDAGITVVSISPYKRQEATLCVLEANHAALRRALSDAQGAAQRVTLAASQAAPAASPDTKQSGGTNQKPARAPFVKSPNCVCCGSSVVLQGVAAAFGPLAEVSVTTFQSLSGRGDAKYPAPLVVGNVYPLRNTSEPTEALIAEELKTVLGPSVQRLSVAAYRVPVQRGHLVDLRIKLVDANAKEKLQDAEAVYRALEAWQPLQQWRERMPSVPQFPVVCDRRGGAPRPKTHHGANGGFSVTVGNVKVHDGLYDIALTLVVDNLVKGALGAALQLLEATLLWGASP